MRAFGGLQRSLLGGLALSQRAAPSLHVSRLTIAVRHASASSTSSERPRKMVVGTLKQSNDTQIPRFGLGTWLAKDHDNLRTALRTAFDNGYRYIDTAAAYGNECVVGEVLAEYIDAGKLKRSDVFLTSKLPFFAHELDVAEQTLKKTLKDLRTSYIDLYLLHTPFSFKANQDGSGPLEGDDKQYVPLDIPPANTWKEFIEPHYKDGTFKSVGISNFNISQLQALYYAVEVKPMNLQIEYHVLWQEKKLRDFAKTLGLTVSGYSILGSPGRADSKNSSFVPGNCLGQPEVIALAKKYNRTPAQILIRFGYQSDVSIFPKSTTEKHIIDNIKLFDDDAPLVLTKEDMEQLESIKEEQRLLILDFASKSRYYPFADEQPTASPN